MSYHCDICGAADGRVVDYEWKEGESAEVAGVCPWCMAAILRLIHGEPPQYALGDQAPRSQIEPQKRGEYDG